MIECLTSRGPDRATILTLHCGELASGGKEWPQLVVEVPHSILSGHTHCYM